MRALSRFICQAAVPVLALSLIYNVTAAQAQCDDYNNYAHFLGRTPVAAHAEQWRGTVETDHSVRKIHNPAEPSQTPETIQLSELWRLDGESDETGFGRIYAAVADEQDNIYLLDTQLKQVVVVGADGEIKDRIGREGEGPSEFRRPVGVLLNPDGTLGVVQNPPAKIALLTPEGTAAGDRYLPDYGKGGRLILRAAQSAAGRLYVVLTRRHHTEQRDTETLNTLASLGSENDEYIFYIEQESFRAVDDNHFTETGRSRGTPWEWTVGPSGCVYTCPLFDAYEIHVFDISGRRTTVIDRPYVSRLRDDGDVADLQDYYDRQFETRARWGYPMTYEVSQTDQDIEHIFARQDGTLWVLSSRGAYDKPEAALGVFDVFNQEGQFARQITLLGDGHLLTDYFLFTRDRLIVVRNVRIDLGENDESDDTEGHHYEVLCYQLP